MLIRLPSPCSACKVLYFSYRVILTRPLISFRTTPCCELRKVKETSGGPEGDSKSVHTKGKGVGLSEI